MSFFNYSVLYSGILIMVAGMLIFAGIADMQRNKIPDILCVLIVLLFPLFVKTSPIPIKWDQHLMVFALLLLGGLGMLWARIITTAHVKLLGATALWVGPRFIAVFIVLMGLTAGALTLMTALRNRGVAGRRVNNASSPYSLAVVISGLGVIYLLLVG